MDDGMEGRREWRGARGGIIIHHVDGDRVGRVLKTKLIVEFSN
jgi:hypothetical protein